MKCLPGWMRFSVNVSDAKKQKACSKAGFLNVAPLTGIALAINWLINKLNLKIGVFKATRMTTNGMQ